MGSRFDVGSLRADGCDPIPNRLCNKLGAIVGAYEGWRATQDEQVGQSVNHICRVQFALHLDRQTFSAVLINDVQRPENLAVICPAVNEVIRPDMVLMLRPQPHA